MTKALEGVEGSASGPCRFLNPGKTRYPLYKRLCGPQGRSGQVWKTSPLLGFDPRTVQPVASRYTDWAIPAHKFTLDIFVILVNTLALISVQGQILRTRRFNIFSCNVLTKRGKSLRIGLKTFCTKNAYYFAPHTLRLSVIEPNMLERRPLCLLAPEILKLSLQWFLMENVSTETKLCPVLKKENAPILLEFEVCYYLKQYSICFEPRMWYMDAANVHPCSK
jgi:hypothetical protein